MFGIGGGEIVLIAVLALLLFGPEKLPEFARTIGRFMRDFRRYQDLMQSTIRAEIFTQGPANETPTQRRLREIEEAKAAKEAAAKAEAEAAAGPAGEGGEGAEPAPVEPEGPAPDPDTSAPVDESPAPDPDTSAPVDESPVADEGTSTETADANAAPAGDTDSGEVEGA